jgi:tryptophan 6-halogenase
MLGRSIPNLTSRDIYMPAKIVIVGGGTAGWMTASYLKSALINLRDVTLIESSHIGTIGVGEATFSTFKLFLDHLGLAEHEWMPFCNGTYKLAIRFQDWTQERIHFYHPFERMEIIDGFNLGEWWLKLQRGVTPFNAACFISTSLCENSRSPRFLDDTIFDDRLSAYFGANHIPNTMIATHSVQYPYGYHFDASMMAEYLKTFAMKCGVKRIVDDVVTVELRPDGSIAHVVTKDHGRIDADLYVDCTGFRGLLINQALKEPFLGFNESLPNDSAVVIRVPTNPAEEGIPPYTTATAMSSGWTWTIPLLDRNSYGYVYCSRYIDRDEAEAELRALLGTKSEGHRANHINMRIGRNRNSWVKNCVAIGLSSAFVEPLESTGIFFIQHALEELVNHFPTPGRVDEGQLLSYNRTINDCIDGIREFLLIHYRASDRSDTPYWRDTKLLKATNSLEERFRIWRSRLPGIRNIYQPFHGFEAYSYAVILLGLKYQPDAHLPTLDLRHEAGARAMFDSIRKKAERLSRTLPSHYAYLQHMRSNG